MTSQEVLEKVAKGMVATGLYKDVGAALRALAIEQVERKIAAYQGGYPLKAGQLEYDCRYSKMHGMPVPGGRGFRGLKPLWYNGVPP